MAVAKTPRVLPGLPLTLGYSLFYLGLVVLVPLSTVFLKSATLDWEQFWAIVSAPAHHATGPRTCRTPGPPRDRPTTRKVAAVT